MRILAGLLLALVSLGIATPAQADPKACAEADGPATCTQRCAAGSQASCAILGVMHLRGEASQPPDHKAAARLLERACQAKVALGCGGLGSLLGVQGKLKRARALLERACKMGDGLSCESVAGHIMGFDPKQPRPKNLEAATRAANVYYRRACELGAGRGCAFAAAYLVDRRIAGSTREAFEMYVKACGLGVGVACRQGAALLAAGSSESRALAATFDTARLTAVLLKRGCELGDRDSCRP